MKLHQKLAQSLAALGLVSVALLVIIPGTALAATDDVDTSSGYFKHKFDLGYRLVEEHGNPLRAREYDSLISGTTAGMEIAIVDDWGHLSLDATLLNKKDFDADLHIEVGPSFRADVRTMSLFHNLDNIDIVRASPEATYTAEDPGEVYGIQVLENNAGISLKPWEYPAHVKLNYWSWEKKGKEQLRWVDENCAGCHIQSKSRTVNRITEEISGSIDAQLGGVKVEALQTFRQYRDEEPIPKSTFASFPAFGPRAGLRAGDDYEHDEDPEARFMASTLKLYSSLAGGLNAAASATYSKRENESQLSQDSPVKSETEIVSGALDITYTPTSILNFVVRGRALDLENETPTTLTAAQFDSAIISPTLDVRDNIDRKEYSGSFAATFRPVQRTSLKLEHNYRQIKRSNTGGPQPFSGAFFGGPRVIDPVWELPEEEVQTKTKLSLFSRPFSGNQLKLRSWYEFRNTDELAYGTSLEDGHTGFLGVDYIASSLWGTNVSARYDYETAEGYETNIEAGAETFSRDRQLENLNLTAMLWLSLTESTTLNVHYGYLETQIEQDVVFGTESGFTIEAHDAKHDQTVHNASANLNWRLLDPLLFTTSARYIQSEGIFDPEFADTVFGAVTATAIGISDVSKVDIRQYGASAGLEWTPATDIRFGVRYTFDKYDDKQDETLDGEVQTYMASVAKSW